MTASIAQRFFGQDVASDVAAMERDVDGAEALVLAELCDLQRRLPDVEGSIQRLGRRPSDRRPASGQGPRAAEGRSYSLHGHQGPLKRHPARDRKRRRDRLQADGPQRADEAGHESQQRRLHGPLRAVPVLSRWRLTRRVTSQGIPHARGSNAPCGPGNLWIAESAARDVQTINLEGAFHLTLPTAASPTCTNARPQGGSPGTPPKRTASPSPISSSRPAAPRRRARTARPGRAGRARGVRHRVRLATRRVGSWSALTKRS